MSEHKPFLWEEGTEFFYTWTPAKAVIPGLVEVDKVPSPEERAKLKAERLERERVASLPKSAEFSSIARKKRRRLGIDLKEQELARTVREPGGGVPRAADTQARADAAAQEAAQAALEAKQAAEQAEARANANPGDAEAKKAATAAKRKATMAQNAANAAAGAQE